MEIETLAEWQKERKLTNQRVDDCSELVDNVFQYIKDPLAIHKFIGNKIGDYCNRDDIDSFHSLDKIVERAISKKVDKKIAPVIDATINYLIANNHTKNNPLKLHNGFAYYIKTKPQKESHKKNVIVFGSDYNDEPNFILIQDVNIIRKRIFIREIWARGKTKDGYTSKPSVKYYRDADFNMSYSNSDPVRPNIYGDCRDIGHVLSYEVGIDLEDNIENDGTCDSPLFYIPQMTHAFRFIQNFDMVVNHGENYDY